MLGFDTEYPKPDLDPFQYVGDTWSPVLIGFLTVILCSIVLVLLMRFIAGLLFWVFAIGVHLFLVFGRQLTHKKAIYMGLSPTKSKIITKTREINPFLQLLLCHCEHIHTFNLSTLMLINSYWVLAFSRLCHLWYFRWWLLHCVNGFNLLLFWSMKAVGEWISNIKKETIDEMRY